MNFSFEFISKMYNNRNSYAEVFSNEELMALHVPSSLEETIKELVKKKKIIFLTGNPGDGKTHLIRIMGKFLAKHDTFTELDINEVQDYTKFLYNLKSSIYQEKPVLIAVNEYPLLELLQFMPEDFPYKSEIIKVKSQNIIYGDQCYDYDNQKVVIIDLNNRNLLEETNINAAFEKLLSNINQCALCLHSLNCTHNKTLKILQDIKVRERIVFLISLLGKTGTHAVMRDILGFIAYLITEGKNCKDAEYEYYDRIFQGKNSLFSRINKLDPSKLTHPIIDEQLWNGTIKEGWAFNTPEYIPANISDSEEAMEAFISIKRKYFFEHEEGFKLINLYPKDLSEFLNLILEVSDDETDVIQKIILSINIFYNPIDVENQKLFIWNSHSYEARKYPETIISNRSIPFQNMNILVPKMPKMLKTLNYIPNHFILRIRPDSRKKEYVDLIINYDLFKMLSLIADGYPSQILPSNHKFTIERFMFNLSAYTKKVQTNEFIIRNIKQNNTHKIIIKDGKYLVKK